MDEEEFGFVEGFYAHGQGLVFAEVHEGVAGPDPKRVVGFAVAVEGEFLERGAVGFGGFGGVKCLGIFDEADGFPCSC